MAASILCATSSSGAKMLKAAAWEEKSSTLISKAKACFNVFVIKPCTMTSPAMYRKVPTLLLPSHLLHCNLSTDDDYFTKMDCSCSL